METGAITFLDPQRLPDIELSLTPRQVARGQRVTARWRAQRADAVTLWQSPVAAATSEPLNWGRLGELGNKVDLAGTLELTPEESTAVYLVARSPAGMRGASAIAFVAAAAKHATEAFACQADQRILGKMIDRPHVASIPGPRCLGPVEIAELVRLLVPRWPVPLCLVPPTAKLSMAPNVIYEDESTTLSWDATGASCATMSFTWDATRLAADSWPSGTHPAGEGWGAGGMVPCGLSPLVGSWSLAGATYTASHMVFYLQASSAPGQSAAASQWLDILSAPKFAASSTPNRIADIKSAIKVIDQNLRLGCILGDAALDTTVAAFKSGHLKRQEIWGRLLAELQNLKLITFHCQDVTSGAGGSWASGSNEIILRWTPTASPNLTYVILHELVHKCGFNSQLMAYYSAYDIEAQTDLVASSCFP